MHRSRHNFFNQHHNNSETFSWIILYWFNFYSLYFDTRWYTGSTCWNFHKHTNSW